MVATRLSRAALTVTVVISMLIGWSREGKLNLMNDEEVEKFEGGVVISSDTNKEIMKEHVLSTHTTLQKKGSDAIHINFPTAQQSTHKSEEIVAQSICTSVATSKKLTGLFYAVGRDCAMPNSGTCNTICSNSTLGNQDVDTRNKAWSCFGAYFVYRKRPSTNLKGTLTTATLGLKVRHDSCNKLNCGPNFCCCRVV